jgi:hypothetical protein
MAQQVLTSSEVSNAQVSELAKVYSLFQNATDLWGKFSTRLPNDQINALGIKVPIEVHPNASLGYYTGNNDTYPTPQASDFDNYTVSYVSLAAGTIETEAAFLNRSLNTSEDMVRYQEQSSARQFASFLNRYISRGNGTMGLGTVSAYTNPSTTVTLNTATDSIGPAHLVTQQKVLFYDATGATQRTGTVGAAAIQINSRSASALVLASNAPSDVVNTDIVVPEIGGSTDASAGLCGLPIIDSSTGTYYGKSRSSFPGLASYEKTSAGTVTAGMLSETYWSTVQRGGWFTGDGTSNLDSALWMVLNTGNAQMYYALSLNSGAVVSSPHYFVHGSDSPKNDIGMASVQPTWFGAPMFVGNDIRGDEIYYLGRDCLRKAVLKDVGDIPVGFPANDYLQSVDGNGNWQSARIKYNTFWGNCYCPDPFRIGKISGITLTAPTQKSTMVTA